MRIYRLLIESLESLNANKLRSMLTVLGIVIGVAAVIAMLSIGQGAQNSITSSINSIGTNLLFVSSGARIRFFGSGEAMAVRNIRPLTMADAAALMDPYQAPSIQFVAPVLQRQ